MRIVLKPILIHGCVYCSPVSANCAGPDTLGHQLYVRLGRMTGGAQLDQNTTWWKPAGDTAPRDPQHPTANDPGAWLEFTVEPLHPYLIADRAYAFDPLTTTAAQTIAAIMTRTVSASGMDWGVLAAAGVLTIIPGALVIWFVRNYIAKGFALGRV